jgi:hypothetical protein
MARTVRANMVVKDGEVSDQWRALQVQSKDFEGRWLNRTDYWPVGITVKPGVDPKDVRAEIVETLSFPGCTYEPPEIRLWDPHL